MMLMNDEEEGGGGRAIRLLLAARRATGTHDCTNFYPFKENISLKIYIFHGNKTDEHPRPTIPRYHIIPTIYQTKAKSSFFV
jgi:hypothetical protein